MEEIKSYKDLIAWKKSLELVRLVYSYTAGFPKAEMFGMVSQMRRAAVSISANIAEGHSRNTTGEYIQFLGIARGSLAELTTFTTLSGDFNYLDSKKFNELEKLEEEVGKLINGLLRSLR